MLKKCLLAFVLSLFAIISHAQLSKYVNPMIGTGGHGHTFPGATTPFGMVQLSPDTRIDGSWDGCSGYHDSDSIIYGFSHTHLSGTGCGDYGDIAFMPGYVSSDILTEAEIKSRPTNLTSEFNHINEKAKAGYYKVNLSDLNVELTATTHAGIQRYTFIKDGIACIQLKLEHRDKLTAGKIEKINSTTYQGYRRSKSWAEDQLVYYSFEVSKESFLQSTYKTGTSDEALFLYFHVKKGEQILVKTGLSSVDEKGAALNLKTEIPAWDFDKVRNDATAMWEKELSKIEVIDSNVNNKIKFYTALYHCMIHPNQLSDVDGKYRGRDQKVHQADGKYYTLYSLWDTHRALHPLLNIIDKERSKDFIKSFQAQFEQSGRLPMWELWNNETNCMIGFHSVSVILDAYVKGVIDKALLEKLYPAVLAEANSNRFGLDKFRKKGYLDVEDESESVSKTLEYAYDMWCVSEIGKILNKTDLIDFAKYNDAWKNVYDVNSGYMRPRKNGDWLKPFNPYEVNNHYTEANAWQYSFFIPHRNDLKQNVLPLFQADTKTAGREQSDITGLVGQYAHGNEPSHNYAYLLPLKERQYYIKKIINELYGVGRDGLCGNDDCGQMSAWFVFSAMGFYPTCPGRNDYDFGVPLFNKVIVNTGNTYKFSISSKNTNTITYPSVSRVQTGTPFGEPATGREVLSHHEITNGQTMYFSDVKDVVAVNNRVFTKESNHLVAPVIAADRQVFHDFNKIELSLPNVKSDTCIELYYSIDSATYKYAKPYKNAFFLMNSTKVYAFAKQGKYVSTISEASFYKMPNQWSVQLRSMYNKQYSAGGPEGLIDGLRGDVDWKKGRWQGYQSQDFEVNIDLVRAQDIKEVSLGCLQDTRSWILMPTKVEIYTSNDGDVFQLAGICKNTVQDNDYAVQVKDFKTKFEPIKARYIKVKATNYGMLPPWHQGAGGDAFIFVDEIKVK